MKSTVNLHTIARRIARRSKALAKHDAQFVTPDSLARTISEYVEWRAFSYWARLTVEIEGHVSERMEMSLSNHCPGFLAYAAVYRQEHPTAREFFWLRLTEWIDHTIFRFAADEGWAHALGFYGARDPGLDQVREYWAACDDAWRINPPVPMPSYEEWRYLTSARTDCSAAPASSG
jgi:hypothetical protein